MPFRLSLIAVVAVAGTALAAVTNRVKLAEAELVKIPVPAQSECLAEACRVKIAPPPALLELPCLQKLPPALAGDIAVLVEADRLTVQLVDKMVALMDEGKIPLTLVRGIVTLASAERLPRETLPQMVALLAASGAPVGTVEAVVALAVQGRVPASFVSSVCQLAVAKALPAAVLQDIVVLVSARKMSVPAVEWLFALAQSGELPPEVVRGVVALNFTGAVTDLDLVDFIVQLEIARVPAVSVAKVAALLPPEVISRFQTLQPAMFSTGWALKVKGLQLEASGENTDAVWRKYWEIFSRGGE